MNLDFLRKLAEIFVSALESKDRFDWLRDGLDNIRNLSEDPRLFSNIDSILQNYIEVDPREGIDKNIYYSLKQELSSILKYFMQKQDYNTSAYIRNLILKLEGNYEEYFKTLKNLPKREFAKPENFLYHGTNAPDAFSILKNKKVAKGSAFDNLSLTTDFTIAAKFGDVIFAFDAKKLQRRQAKKMKYLPIEQITKERLYEPTEGYHNPFISDIYKHEQEWIVPLPFSFTDEDLLKIVILQTKKEQSESRKRIAEMLKTVTASPVEIQYLPSYARFSPDISSEEELDKAELRHVVYNRVFEPLNIIKNEASKIIKEYKMELEKRYPEDAEFQKVMLERNEDIVYLNRIYSRIREPFSHGTSNWESLFDIKRVIDSIDLDENVIKNIENSKFRNLSKYFSMIKYSKDDVINAYKEVHLRSDDDYLKNILGYRSIYHAPLKGFLIQWLNNNAEKFEERVKNISEEQKNLDWGYKYLLEEIDPRVLSDEFWRSHIDILLNNDNIGAMSQDRIENAFSDNPDLHSFVFGISGDSIRGWRKDLSEGQNRRAMEQIISILDKEGIVADKINE